MTAERRCLRIEWVRQTLNLVREQSRGVPVPSRRRAEVPDAEDERDKQEHGDTCAEGERQAPVRAHEQTDRRDQSDDRSSRGLQHQRRDEHRESRDGDREHDQARAHGEPDDDRNGEKGSVLRRRAECGEGTDDAVDVEGRVAEAADPATVPGRKTDQGLGQTVNGDADAEPGNDLEQRLQRPVVHVSPTKPEGEHRHEDEEQAALPQRPGCPAAGSPHPPARAGSGQERRC